MGGVSVVLSVVSIFSLLLVPQPLPSEGVCMRLDVSMRRSIPLCHEAYGSFHVFGIAKKHVFKIACKGFRGGGGGPLS